MWTRIIVLISMPRTYPIVPIMLPSSPQHIHTYISTYISTYIPTYIYPTPAGEGPIRQLTIYLVVCSPSLFSLPRGITTSHFLFKTQDMPYLSHGQRSFKVYQTSEYTFTILRLSSSSLRPCQTLAYIKRSITVHPWYKRSKMQGLTQSVGFWSFIYRPPRIPNAIVT